MRCVCVPLNAGIQGELAAGCRLRRASFGTYTCRVNQCRLQTLGLGYPDARKDKTRDYCCPANLACLQLCTVMCVGF